MKGYLSIGEFARLRHVNQKSLRYYERIGALWPAYTDPDTGYRYYAPEQLIEMDMILMCLELDIPLRDAARYRNEDQTLDIEQLLCDGKQKAQQKLAHLQDSLRQMEDALRRVREGEACQGQTGSYRRRLPRRFILREVFSPTGGALGFKQASARIFQHGQSLGLLPVFTFPIGLVAERKGGTISTDIFLEVLPQSGQESGLDVLPDGSYLCRQQPDRALAQTDRVIEDHFAAHPETKQLVITNLSTVHFDPKGPVLELQQYLAP